MQVTRNETTVKQPRQAWSDCNIFRILQVLLALDLCKTFSEAARSSGLSVSKVLSP